MLASASDAFFSHFKTFSRHRIRGVRRLLPHLLLPRFSLHFPRHLNNRATLECAAAAPASRGGDFVESTAADAAGVDTDAFKFQTLSTRQKEQISIFVSALLEWNERMNLTAAMQESEVMTRHVEDSLALLPPLCRFYLSRCCSTSSSHCVGLKLVDVGSGSGLPGLIIAIACPTWKVTLLESMQKRCSFLEYAISLTSLSNVEVLRERAENVGQCVDFRELFDVAVARAVAEMRILAEYCLPLVRVGGLFIAAKGHNPQEEIRNSEKAIKLMGGSIVELCAVDSHSPLGQRTAVICYKDHATPKKYPRNTDVGEQTFDQNYAVSWGNEHARMLHGGKEIALSMDNTSGSGFGSKLKYASGFFHLNIKVPEKNSAGVVTTFYVKFSRPFYSFVTIMT